MAITLAVQIITKALCIAIDVIVLFLNPLIIDVIHNDRAIRRQPSAVFITNLAIADMFVAGTNLLNMILHFMDLSRVVPVCVVLYGFFSVSMINASLLFMFCNSIDRFVFIRMSFHYHATMRRCCVRALVISVWCVSLLTPILPYLLIDHVWDYGSCVELFHSQVYRVFHFILAVVFVLTLLATVIMFISVYQVVRRSQRLRRLPLRTFSSETAMSGSTWLSLQNSPDSPRSSVLLSDSLVVPTCIRSEKQAFVSGHEPGRKKRGRSLKTKSLTCSIVKKPRKHLCDSHLSDDDEVIDGCICRDDYLKKSAVRETKSESLWQIRSHRKKRSCARKAVDRTNELTHIWCAKPAVANVSFSPDMMPDSIFIFRQDYTKQQRENFDVDLSNTVLPAGRGQRETPRINCLEYNGKFSIVIESSALVSELSRSIAAHYETSSSNTPVASDNLAKDQSSKSPGEVAQQSESISATDAHSCEERERNTPYLARPSFISLEGATQKPNDLATSRKCDAPANSLRPSRFSFLDTASALRKKLSTQSSSTTPSTPFGVPAYTGRDMRTIKILFLMFCVYLLLWFPTFLVNVLRSLSIEISLEVVVICYTFGVSNSVVNFFVYPMKIPRLKQVFKQLLQKSFNGAKKKMKRRLLSFCH
uniref:G-protein coupled receptors family 1 profile domain-containing protein n=1 Tax=Biomphalaria glabrata TaxID=6526 RepID=A0A2C9LS90_BIOGL